MKKYQQRIKEINDEIAEIRNEYRLIELKKLKYDYEILKLPILCIESLYYLILKIFKKNYL